MGKNVTIYNSFSTLTLLCFALLCSTYCTYLPLVVCCSGSGSGSALTNYLLIYLLAPTCSELAFSLIDCLLRACVPCSE